MEEIKEEQIKQQQTKQKVKIIDGSRPLKILYTSNQRKHRTQRNYNRNEIHSNFGSSSPLALNVTWLKIPLINMKGPYTIDPIKQIDYKATQSLTNIPK